jgi:hypothetical protein
MTPTNDFNNILPPEITAKATRSGNEWVLPMAEANQAIRLASAHAIAILGVELFRIQTDGLGVENYSGYGFEYQGDWPAYVRFNNEAALHFIAAHPAEPGHGYILTTTSEDEFKALKPSKEESESRS